MRASTLPRESFRSTNVSLAYIFKVPRGEPSTKVSNIYLVPLCRIYRTRQHLVAMSPASPMMIALERLL